MRRRRDGRGVTEDRDVNIIEAENSERTKYGEE